MNIGSIKHPSSFSNHIAFKTINDHAFYEIYQQNLQEKHKTLQFYIKLTFFLCFLNIFLLPSKIKIRKKYKVVKHLNAKQNLLSLNWNFTQDF